MFSFQSYETFDKIAEVVMFALYQMSLVRLPMIRSE